MANIGHVQYIKGTNKDQLLAVWMHSDYGSGTGRAHGKISSGFEGHYDITYYDDQNAKLTDLKLEIKKDDDRYFLTWRNSNKVISFGIGLVNCDVLSASYIDV